MQPEFRNAKGAYRVKMDALESGEVPEPAAERIKLVASVILKAVPNR